MVGRDASSSTYISFTSLYISSPSAGVQRSDVWGGGVEREEDTAVFALLNGFDLERLFPFVESLRSTVNNSLCNI